MRGAEGGLEAVGGVDAGEAGADYYGVVEGEGRCECGLGGHGGWG